MKQPFVDLPNVSVTFLRTVPVHFISGGKSTLCKKGQTRSVPGRLQGILTKGKLPYAKMAEGSIGFTVEEEEESGEAREIQLYSHHELTKLGIADVRSIGEVLNVGDSKKSKLITKILEAQFYSKEYLQALTHDGLLKVADSLSVPIGNVEETIKEILALQEEGDEEEDE